MEFLEIIASLACILTGIAWGTANHMINIVSKSNTKYKQFKLFGIVVFDKLSGILFILSLQKLDLGVAAVLADGTSILAAYLMEKGTRFFTLKNLFSCGLIFYGIYLFAS